MSPPPFEDAAAGTLGAAGDVPDIIKSEESQRGLSYECVQEREREAREVPRRDAEGGVEAGDEAAFVAGTGRELEGIGRPDRVYL